MTFPAEFIRKEKMLLFNFLLFAFCDACASRPLARNTGRGWVQRVLRNRKMRAFWNATLRIIYRATGDRGPIVDARPDWAHS